MIVRSRNLCLPLLLLAMASSSLSAKDAGTAFFENKVRPLLVKHCYSCHSEQAKKRQGGLWLDRKSGWEEGGDSGPSIVPGQPARSLFIQSIRYKDEHLQMPPKNRLPDDEVRILEQWVAMGAPDPRRDGPAAPAKKTLDIEAARQGWAYRPLAQTPAPVVKQTDWPRSDLDRFILAAIEAKGLKPAADSHPQTLLRRLSFDLTGLPPTPEAVTAFTKAYAKATPEQRQTLVSEAVDRMLASPAFGEKWGRLWLDLARYADSNGGDRNYTFFQAWRYRNYVIDAFNSDKPYYQFLREQIAGDLLPAASDAQRREQLIASTFLALGPKMLTERDKEKLQLDTVDEQLDTLGKAFLGLSIGCARCHDHKFDPVSQHDYYALAGIFRGTEVVMGTRNGCVNVASWVEQPLPGPKAEELRKQVARLELTMRLKVERDFMQKASGKKSLEKLPLAGVLYDEADAELTGTWKQSSLSPNRFGEFYVHDDRQQKGEKKAIFRGSLPETGVYEVRIAYPAKSNCDKAVPITVTDMDGEHKVVLDQTKKPRIGGLFEPIGRFRFEKGGKVEVAIGTAGTKDYVIVDAVQFISEKDIEREATALAMASGRGKGDPVLTMSSGDLAKELTRQIDALRDADLAMAPRDFADAGDVNLRIRGEPNQLGPKVPRGFPSVLHRGAPPSIPAGSSGRLLFANWLVNPDNALLDRVIVNRLWAQLFGRGLVASVDNFGVQGEKPSHPELLDHLAAKFRAEGGSIKGMIRAMVLSRTYQLAAEGKSARTTADPENRLFSRHGYRRLTGEELRDTLLLLTGDLQTGPAEATSLSYGIDLDRPLKLDSFTHRSIYIPVARNNLAPDLELFDAANPEMTAGERPLTTVPTQALYLLNSPFVNRQAAKLAKSAAAEPDPVNWLYERILGHKPGKGAAQRAADFLEFSDGGRDRALTDLAHVLLASTEFLFLE